MCVSECAGEGHDLGQDEADAFWRLPLLHEIPADQGREEEYPDHDDAELCLSVSVVQGSPFHLLPMRCLTFRHRQNAVGGTRLDLLKTFKIVWMGDHSPPDDLLGAHRGQADAALELGPELLQILRLACE